MSENIKQKKSKAKELHEQARAKAEGGDFAYKLAARSLESHLDELSQIAIASEINPAFEMLDFRLVAPNLKTGSAPLDLVAKLTEEIRKTFGHAALRLKQGGINRSRIPKDLFQELDLRLAGLLPGSSRFIISAAANRDLLDDGISKGAIERVFAVLSSMGKGNEFLSAVNLLGPLAAKSLRECLKVIMSHSAEAEVTWKYSGEEILKWNGSKDALRSVTSALESTVVVEQEKILLQGKIELLSKREKIELRALEGKLYKILYPKSLLPIVSELHLEQTVSLYCQVTQTENPLTNESLIFYELIELKS
jgi:hypothetical protein